MSESTEPNDVKKQIYVTRSLADEWERRANTGGDDAESESKIARRALREYFRRHPAPRTGDAAK